MATRGQRLLVCMAACILPCVWSAEARGQSAARGQTRSGTPLGRAAGGGTYGYGYGNPYAVPGLNPFLNPYVAGTTAVSPDVMALSWMAAQRETGGIGSGELSGVRQLERGQNAGQTASRGESRTGPYSGVARSRYFANRTGRPDATPQVGGRSTRRTR